MVREIRRTAAVMLMNVLCGSFTTGHAQDSTSFTLGVGGGMGITAITATDLVDYVNATASPPQRLDDFSSAAEFFGSIQMRVTDSWGAKFEYAYLINSYNIVSGFGMHEYSYVIHMPTVLLHYLIVQRGFAFKFGSGPGYYVSLLTERLQGTAERKFTSPGIGMKIDAEANTMLDEHLYVYLDGDVRFGLMRAYRDAQGNHLTVSDSGGVRRKVSMDFFALGLKFGIIYYF